MVDDDAVTRLVVQAMVRSLGHDCLLATNGHEGWETISANADLDVVITDRMMPDMDGLELCQRIRRDTPPDHYVYVVLASGLGDDDSAREGMLAGADDYVVKPMLLAQLELRLIAAQRVKSLHERLARLSKDLRETARRDPLTGLNNRLQLSEDLATLTDRARRYGHRYGLALLDVDHFKQFNDRYGHQAGDAALQAVAGILTRMARAGDSSYRYGGEELLCIFPEQSGHTALLATTRMLNGVRGLAITHEGSPYGVLTMSAGVHEISAEQLDAETALSRADQALYQAKDGGRDQAILYRSAANENSR